MIRRLYIHNFRCLENFELPISGQSSVLLIGKNGAGKTTVGLALEILQKIARGTNRIGDLVTLKDVARGRLDLPVRFEIEVTLRDAVYSYAVAFEYPRGFKELRVFEEALKVDGKAIYTRDTAQVRVTRTGNDKEAVFRMDWHLVALPIIQRPEFDDPLTVFRQWLSSALILRPIPSLMFGDSSEDTIQPQAMMTDFGAWFSGLLATAPAAYSKIDSFLKGVMPDFQDLKNPVVGNEARSLIVQFSNRQQSVALPFQDLSDGEKCFMIFALTIAANDAYGPLLCFWDEPDNYLSPSEVGACVMALRKAFKVRGQLIVTSHNPEAIRRFSDENTLVLYRNSHLEPTIARLIDDIRASGDLQGDLVDALIRGDIPE